MNLFKKNKPAPTPVVNHSEVEQGKVPQPPLDPVAELSQKVSQVIANQQIIVQNQQVIMDAIGNTQQLMVQLATGEEAPAQKAEEEEPTEEELREAALALRKQKAPVPKTTIKKR